SHIWPSFENADRRRWLRDHRAASVRIERCLEEGPVCAAGSKNRQNIERRAYRRGRQDFQGHSSATRRISEIFGFDSATKPANDEAKGGNPCDLCGQSQSWA